MSDRRPISAAGMGTFGRTPSWGSEWKAFVMQNADRTNTSYLQKTTLPYEDNFLDLDPTVKDPLGFPVCRITADYKDNERRVSAMAQERMTAVVQGGGRDRDAVESDRHHGPDDACVWRDAHGPQSRNQRRQ